MFLCLVFNLINNLTMKQMNEETPVFLQELSKEEMQNTFGGSWWEVRAINGKIVFIFHP